MSSLCTQYKVVLNESSIRDGKLLMWCYQQMLFVKDNDCSACKERSKWSPTECWRPISGSSCITALGTIGTGLLHVISSRRGGKWTELHPVLSPPPSEVHGGERMSGNKVQTHMNNTTEANTQWKLTQ